MQADFGEQLANVRDEFARMSEIAVKEQEELNGKIADLEEELNAAKLAGQTVTAGAALEQKKKIEAVQNEYEAKLKKNEARLEKISKQLEEMKGKSTEQEGEIAELDRNMRAREGTAGALILDLYGEGLSRYDVERDRSCPPRILGGAQA